jgi:hypothetical protein
VNGFPVTVTGEDNGQAIVIHPGAHEFLVVGFRASVSFADPTFQWPTMQQVSVKRVYWAGDQWKSDGEPEYQIDQANKILEVDLDTPSAVVISWQTGSLVSG